MDIYVVLSFLNDSSVAIEIVRIYDNEAAAHTHRDMLISKGKNAWVSMRVVFSDYVERYEAPYV